MKERQENLAGIYPRQRIVTVHTGEQFLWWDARNRAGDVHILAMDVGNVMGSRKRDAGEHFLYRLLLNEHCAPTTEYPARNKLTFDKALGEFRPAQITPQAPAPKPAEPAKPLTQSEMKL
jgi:hypothetical protein